jgi:hypothetical protein
MNSTIAIERVDHIGIRVRDRGVAMAISSPIEIMQAG